MNFSSLYPRLTDVLQNNCAAACRKLGLPPILPALFRGGTIDDLVLLHSMLFSLQYSSAKSWIESGIQVDALIGHSFGQIVALCVAGSISLEHALLFVSKRALLIREKWNTDPGAMMAIDCSHQQVEDLRSRLKEVHNLHIDVACYNGPGSFVLSGSSSSIEKAKEESTGLKTTDLHNTHAYHSYGADIIMDDLLAVAQSLDIRIPPLHVETCSKDSAWSQFTAQELAEHTREPVFFHDAVQRLSSRFPSAIWVEAGSATPVIAMTRRLLQESNGSEVFVPVNISTLDAKKNLSEAITKLWLSGASVKYWGFHPTSNYRYKALDLPPYQFETHSQWINLGSVAQNKTPLPGNYELDLVIEAPHLVRRPNERLYQVNTAAHLFQLAGQGHRVYEKGICPASLYVEIAIAGATKASAGTHQPSVVPHLENITMSAPLYSADASAGVSARFLQLTAHSWEFSIFSSPHQLGRPLKHACGTIRLARESDDLPPKRRLGLLQQVMPMSRAGRILDSASAEGMSGPLVYKSVNDVVKYASCYRGVTKLSALAEEAAGIVALSYAELVESSRRLHASIAFDNFLQVADLHINCLSPHTKDEVFMCTGIEEIVFSDSVAQGKPSLPQRWHVYSYYEPVSDSSTKHNVLVYDSDSQTLVVAIINATFKSVPLGSLRRSLSKLSTQNLDELHINGPDFTGLAQDSGYQSRTSPTSSGDNPFKKAIVTDDAVLSQATNNKPKEKDSSDTGTQIGVQVQDLSQVIARILEIPVDEVKPTSTMEALGIDSLVTAELRSDIQRAFGVTVSQDQLRNSTDVQRLFHHVRGCLEPDQQPSNIRLDKDGTERHDAQIATIEKELWPMTTHQETNWANKKVPATTDPSSISRRCFLQAKADYDRVAAHVGFAGFYNGPFKLQSKLVLKYVTEAFASMGICLTDLEKGQQLPTLPNDPRHDKLALQLFKILEEAAIIERGDSSGAVFFRTGQPIPTETAESLHHKMLAAYPQHASETSLLRTTGSKLASCLLGTDDPLALIFKDARARSLLEDVYANAPMFKTGTVLLAQYLVSLLENARPDRETRILEIGAGTGGTTSFLVAQLTEALQAGDGGSLGRLSYTFTDVSPSLVVAARRKFAKWDFMEYAVLDIEKEPPPQLLDTYDIVISTNCVHATKDLVRSATNIRKTLREGGILCLVELTRNLFWFDLVFGLLEGWWLFDDGRQHALAHEEVWKTHLLSAGFSFVDWTSSDSDESAVLRVITAWTSNLLPDEDVVASGED